MHHLALLIVAGFWLTDRLARRTIARWPGLGIGDLAAPASIPLVVLILNLLLFVTGPAARAVSRAEERDADRFALDLTRDPVAAASCLLKFGRHGLGEYDVDPWIEALLYGHPSLGRRIGDVRTWARAHPRAE